MLPDPFHFRRALQPQGLRTLSTVGTAIQQAIANAGATETDPLDCPAVQLLIRHQQRIAARLDIDAAYPEDEDLRAACQLRIEQIQRYPMLTMLHAIRAPTQDTRRLLIRETRGKLKQLADCFDLREGDYTLRTTETPATDPEISLHTDHFYVRISRPFITGNEILYRRVTSRTDHLGGRNHWAPIDRLEDPPTFARDLSRTLEIHYA